MLRGQFPSNFIIHKYSAMIMQAFKIKQCNTHAKQDLSTKLRLVKSSTQ